ncbi:hypothetical protein L1987_45916 [Smallanthus sonchifolius]|uniref:Uncharacterized protein n=1 Tax=Smallanthus sonchifolius TaxID=185202 RepID=A0ACB9FYE3_9ASTR|nr:hypothetical protein L1987_45916 [Smallanthus sonchifolius]
MNTLLRNEASSLFFFQAPIRSRSPLLTGSRLISLPLATQMFQFAKFEKSKDRRLATELGYGFPIGDPWITDGISPWPFASESVFPSQCPGIHPMHSFRSCTHGAESFACQLAGAYVVGQFLWGNSHVWRNVFPHGSTILGNSHWVVGAGNISLSMANWGAGAFSVQNVDLNTPFREVIQSANFSTLVLPSLSTEAQSILDSSGMLFLWMTGSDTWAFKCLINFISALEVNRILYFICFVKGSFIFSGCWEIWLARNAFVHDSVAMSSSSIINKVKHWCKDLLQLDYPTHSSGFHDSICFQVSCASLNIGLPRVVSGGNGIRTHDLAVG